MVTSSSCSGSQAISWGGKGQPFRQGREDIPREAKGSPTGWASYRAPCRVLSMSHLSLDPHGDPAREVFY